MRSTSFSIIRGTHYMNIPNGNDRIYPRDHIQVIGTDEQIERFSGALANTVIVEAEYQDREMQLKQFLITEVSGFVGVKIKNSGIRDRYHCMIVGIETPMAYWRSRRPKGFSVSETSFGW